MLDEKIALKDYEGLVRQLAVGNHGREKPTFIITNDFDSSTAEAITDYTRRTRIENNISENVDFFSLNALPSYLTLKIDADLVFTLLADNIYKTFAREINGHSRNKPETLFRRFIHKNARIRLDGDEIVVRFDYSDEQHHIKRLYEQMNGFLEERGIDTRISWLLNKKIRYEFVEK